MPARNCTLWIVCALSVTAVLRPAPLCAQAVKLAPLASERLKEKVSVSYIDTPLERALEHLQRRTGASIVIDRTHLDRARLLHPVSLSLEDVTLKEVLDWLVKIGGIGYRTEGRVIFVSTPAVTLAPEITMKIYDVADLATTIRDYPGPDFAISVGGVEDVAGTGGTGVTILDADAGLGGDAADASSIAEMITTRIEPDRWAVELGTSIEQRGNQLIVIQTPDVHRQIDAMLRDMRRVGLRMISFSVRVYESGTDTTTKLLDGQPDAHFLNEAGLKQLDDLADLGTVTLRGAYRTTCFNLQRISFTAGRQYSYVADYEIQGDGFDPVVRMIHDGLVFDIRPIIVESRREIMAEVRLTHITVDPEMPVVEVSGTAGILTGAKESQVTAGPVRVHTPRIRPRRVRTVIRIPESSAAVFTSTLPGDGPRGRRELLMVLQPRIIILRGGLK